MSTHIPILLDVEDNGVGCWVPINIETKPKPIDYHSQVYSHTILTLHHTGSVSFRLFLVCNPVSSLFHVLHMSISVWKCGDMFLPPICANHTLVVVFTF